MIANFWNMFFVNVMVSTCVYVADWSYDSTDIHDFAVVSGDQKESIVALPKPSDIWFKAETQSDFLLNGLDLGENTHELNWNSPAIWMSQRNSRDAVPLIFRGLFWTLVGFYTGITAENPETAG